MSNMRNHIYFQKFTTITFHVTFKCKLFPKKERIRDMWTAYSLKSTSLRMELAFPCLGEY